LQECIRAAPSLFDHRGHIRHHQRLWPTKDDGLYGAQISLVQSNLGTIMNASMMRYPLTLSSILERSGALFPTEEIVSRGPDGSLHRYTYADFYRRTHALAAALLQAGLKRGDRVGTFMWNHHTHLEAYFAVPCAGGVIHTLNLRLHPDELAYIVNHARDRFLIVDDVLLPLFEKFAPAIAVDHVVVVPFAGATQDTSSLTGYEEFITPFLSGAPFDLPMLEEDEAAEMCFTSGTTGKPKGVVYSHRALVLHAFAGCMADTLGISQRDVVFPLVPMFHANAWGIPHASTMVGARQIFPGTRFDAEGILEILERERVTFSAGVPTIWLGVLAALEKDPQRASRLPKARLLCGGAAPPESLIRAFDKYGLHMIHAWGMTETTPLATVNFTKRGLEDLDPKRGYAIRATQGLPAPFVDLRVRAQSGLAPWDGKTVGELEVRGPWVAANYFEQPDAADRWTEDGWFRTGDVACIDGDGYLRITDRVKDLIKSGGEWISSVELESHLMAHPAVREAAVVAVPDPKWQERPLAVVVLKEGAKANDEDLRQHLESRVACFWIPETFVFVDSIPHTSTGKTLKSELRKTYQKYTQSSKV
jgi:fatty-acyl-CoA synthase